MSLRFLTIFTILLCSFSMQAQQNITLDIAAGYTITGNGGSGPVMHLEPTFKHSESVSVGVRLEIAKISKTSNGEIVASKGVDFSIAPNAQYFIKKGELKYVIGIGAGVFSRGSYINPVDPSDFQAT